MTIVHLAPEGQVRPGIYDEKIIVPNAKEMQYLRSCFSCWGISRENFKFKRGSARLKYRPVNQVLK